VSANKCAIPSTDYCNSPPDNDARRLKTSRVAGHNTVTPGLNTNATGARPISRGEADAVCSTQTPGGQIGSSVCHTRRVAGAVPAVLQLPGRALISSAVPPLACGCRAAVLHHLSPLPPPPLQIPSPFHPSREQNCRPITRVRIMFPLLQGDRFLSRTMVCSCSCVQVAVDGGEGGG
jgi:hypothetical protein